MNKRILIIDDNADNRSVLEQMLTLEGFSYLSLGSGADVESTIASDTDFDAVFLDLEMPKPDGYSVFRTLKADAEFQNIPVVAYSVHVSEIGVVRDMGFDGFMGKPINADEFAQNLQKIVNGESIWINP